MVNTKKIKKIKRTKRLLNNKERQINLEKFILEFTQELDTINKIVKKSEEIIDDLEEEEDLVKRLELDLQLEALKYVMEEIGEEKNNIDNLSYPEIGDPNFSLKIARKKEFNQYKINNEEWNSGNLGDISKKCSWTDLSQTQKFLQNFISPMTPYNGLLLFHGVGVGKTCSSITIAEGMKDYLEERKKKVYVLLKPTIRENFKRSIIDLNKLNMGDDNQCTGDNYFDEMGKSFVGKKIKKAEDLKKLERKANKIINRYYDFFGYGEFVNIFKQIDNSIKVKDKKERLIILQKKLKDKFADSVIIIDEAHNITPRDKGYEGIKTKKIRGGSYFKGGSYNDFTEGLVLTKSEQDGKEVSGILMKIIKMVDDMKIILLSATPMYNEASEIVYLLNLLLANDNKPLLNAKKMFNNGKITDEGKKILQNKIPGYVSYLRSENPINYPYKLVPTGRDILNKEDIPTLDMKGNIIPMDKRISHMSFVNCPMSDIQLEIYQKYFDMDETKVNAFDTVGSQICNITYTDNMDLKKEDIEDVGEYYSDKGFKKILNKSKKKYNFADGKFKDYFSITNLKKVAPKMAKIVSNVNNSNGINFVYSQFKNSGVFPLAFALEMEGYVNFDGSTLLNFPRNHTKKLINGKPAKYLIITGESSVDFNKYKKDKEFLNKDGSELKVILGTQAASEGLNIFNVRGIHILDPWHHLNRLEQIVGRGLRSCSHRNLPLEERNLTVFLYVVTYPDNIKETLDLKMYRKAEEKTINVSEVQRELKSLAVDCHLNKEGNVYIGDKWNTPIRVKNLFGEEKDIIIGDNAGSRICDYMEDCDYKCFGGELGVELNNSTYSLEFSLYDIKSVVKFIKNYFKKTKKVKSTFKQIFEYIKKDKPDISKMILSKSLYNIIDKDIIVKDRINRDGTIIYRGNKYIFQPKGLSNTISMLERRVLFKKRTKKLGLKTLLEKTTKKKGKQTTTKLYNDLFIELEKNIKTYMKNLVLKDNKYLDLVIGEVLDRLEYNSKLDIYKNILDKLIEMEDILNIWFDEELGIFIFEDCIERLLIEFSLNDETSILGNILDYTLKHKFFKVNGNIGFKISNKNEIKYLKMNKGKILELDTSDMMSLNVEYINKLKEIKISGKKLSDLYGFIMEDKKSNIIFKILEKKDGVTKSTQQSKGSSCIHFTISKLRELLLKNTTETIKIKGKNNICYYISFYMKKLNMENKENLIYFYELDDYLELK